MEGMRGEVVAKNAIKKWALFPQNKRCFDCLHPSTRFVNCTVGSFICTTCTLLLREFRPPHSIKLISKGVFSEEELQFIRSRGNEVCRMIWLHGFVPESEARPKHINEKKQRTFLSAKYLQRLWYNPANIPAVENNPPRGDRPKTVAESSATADKRLLIESPASPVEAAAIPDLRDRSPDFTEPEAERLDKDAANADAVATSGNPTACTNEPSTGDLSRSIERGLSDFRAGNLIDDTPNVIPRVGKSSLPVTSSLVLQSLPVISNTVWRLTPIIPSTSAVLFSGLPRHDQDTPPARFKLARPLHEATPSNVEEAEEAPAEPVVQLSEEERMKEAGMYFSKKKKKWLSIARRRVPCFVARCTNRQDPPVSVDPTDKVALAFHRNFYRFPKLSPKESVTTRSSRFYKWMEFCKRADPSKTNKTKLLAPGQYSRICGEHFDRNAFTGRLDRYGRKQLRSDAVPTLKSPKDLLTANMGLTKKRKPPKQRGTPDPVVEEAADAQADAPDIQMDTSFPAMDIQAHSLKRKQSDYPNRRITTIKELQAVLKDIILPPGHVSIHVSAPSPDSFPIVGVAKWNPTGTNPANWYLMAVYFEDGITVPHYEIFGKRVFDPVEPITCENQLRTLIKAFCKTDLCGGVDGAILTDKRKEQMVKVDFVVDDSKTFYRSSECHLKTTFNRAGPYKQTACKPCQTFKTKAQRLRKQGAKRLSLQEQSTLKELMVPKKSSDLNWDEKRLIWDVCGPDKKPTPRNLKLAKKAQELDDPASILSQRLATQDPRITEILHELVHLPDEEFASANSWPADALGLACEAEGLCEKDFYPWLAGNFPLPHHTYLERYRAALYREVDVSLTESTLGEAHVDMAAGTVGESDGMTAAAEIAAEMSGDDEVDMDS
ncbi:putative Arf-GAP domain and FG repeat-containing protein 1 [Hypsibius exemplaris]|uniref:Arf-GAP domain and FG repeat-containing protein 1 n=1 Tax=Hypsibius exemplaris TaxID=2072580 RepID=A0A9X6NH61_HYPEX|nr:putative Arf-GAP domain and FG repeat-containing protein 1 [Hypsibius exemplaris]